MMRLCSTLALLTGACVVACSALGCASEDTPAINYGPPQDQLGEPQPGPVQPQAGMQGPPQQGVAGPVTGPNVGPGPGNTPGDPQPGPQPVASGDPTMDSGMPAPTTPGTDAGETDPPDNSVRPPCMKDPRQVIVLGDSYINWVSHTFPQDLVKHFGNGSAGVWDVPYGMGGRLYAIGAWAMGSGGIGLIPDQLGFALDDDPNIIAAVMTGGGNDVLVPSAEWVGGTECKNSSAMPPPQVCQDIANKGFDAARELMMRSADAGIRDVVYFFYPEVPAPTLIGGSSPNTILQWCYPIVQELCESTEEMTDGRLRCHFLDTRPIFAGHADYFAPTDIHPSPAGSDALTKAIADLMRERCIAQPESSGCCEP